MRKITAIVLGFLISASCYAGVNNIVSFGFYDKSFNPNIKRPPPPLIWSATTKIEHGATLLVEHNIYHTKKHFSINAGASIGWWERQRQSLYTFSGFLAFRLFLLRTNFFAPYIVYSVAGPTIMSRSVLNKVDLGGHFTWQDFLGIGARFGRNRAIDIEAKLQHYSNGDFLAENPGFDVPIVLSIGYAFG